MEIPLLSMDLINVLDQRFPDRCADPTDTERAIWIKVGQRKVVSFLLAQVKEQEEKKSSK